MREGSTPIRQQYLRIKRKYPQAILLFRLGDFYETFDEDAKIVSRELDIVLTSREMGKGNKVPLAGIPYHALENYLARLVNRGYKVAICEQVTRPGEIKGLVEREVVRVITPGTVVESGLLDSKTNNYLVSIIPGDREAGIAYIDISTSEFATTQIPAERIMPEIERLAPSEIITLESAVFDHLKIDIPVTRLDDYWFEYDIAHQTLIDHYKVSSLEGYGCASLPYAVRAAGAIIHYLQETQKAISGQLTGLSTYSTESFMALDEQTLTNLEVFRSSSARTGVTSLLSVIDLTKTAMGGRLLRRWLGKPLLDIEEITKRQMAVKWFYENTLPRNEVISLLDKMSDIERLINRVKSNLANPRELVSLKKGLEIIPELVKVIEGGTSNSWINWLKSELKPRQDVVDLVAEAITDEPATNPGDGDVIKQGFSEELDNLRNISRNARQYLANLEKEEQEKTGIKSLKVGYNRVFGYYIEVSNSYLSQVPDYFIRKQTLVGGERFYTPELKDYESTILNAKERVAELETNLFQRVCRQVSTASDRILAVADALANADVFSTLAEVSVRYGYCCPTLNNGTTISITNGRHPVVERNLEDSDFVPNDTFLSNDDSQIIILTGPNMAGKSTYLKQVALIVLMAQIGSFVPADSAEIGIVDRVFTRIGAREDLAAGQSTFMAEMVETANILNNATTRSLLILDEIGRGTSTYDGMSIARAVAEYIHNHPGLGAKTLFATHYHEMVELADFLPRVKNYNVAVTEEKGKVIFLRKILPGGVDKSYGIHVAQLAGLPRQVVNRANEVLEELESVGSQKSPSTRKKPNKKELAEQMSFFGHNSALIDEITNLDIESLTPLEALNKLYELQKKVENL
ncbi:MAG: DNA mismatch repair protein MutS [Chloroflexi bacterium RBG_13_46_14]|nr:MAG: DNA mismatch repair protein MutS [Chloroflexi bacterium RBG_13_46_14]